MLFALTIQNGSHLARESSATRGPALEFEPTQHFNLDTKIHIRICFKMLFYVKFFPFTVLF
jgi:hypothetical protein